MKLLQAPRPSRVDDLGVCPRSKIEFTPGLDALIYIGRDDFEGTVGDDWYTDSAPKRNEYQDAVTKIHAKAGGDGVTNV